MSDVLIEQTDISIVAMVDNEGQPDGYGVAAKPPLTAEEAAVLLEQGITVEGNIEQVGQSEAERAEGAEAYTRIRVSAEGGGGRAQRIGASLAKVLISRRGENVNFRKRILTGDGIDMDGNHRSPFTYRPEDTDEFFIPDGFWSM